MKIDDQPRNLTKDYGGMSFNEKVVLTKMNKDKIKIYQGGSTGLVQQKGIRSNKKKLNHHIYLKTLKMI